MRVLEVAKKDQEELALLRRQLEDAKRAFGARADRVRVDLLRQEHMDVLSRVKFSTDYKYLVVHEDKEKW